MRRTGIVVAALGAYLVLALVAWWHVWTGGVAHTITADGYGDPAQQVWFIGWIPHAISAGLNPFVSHAMYAPKGINLVAQTSIMFPALVLSPVTAAFGPLVAFNVGVLLAPVASAYAAFYLCRRYTTFTFGAWLGGLFYGFSPFLLNDLSDGHLHLTLIVFPPLIFAVLDDLLVRQRGSAWSRGLLLGLLVTAQFFTSIELLFMVAVLAVVGVVLLALANPHQVRPRLGRALTGFAVAVVVAGVLLAWPLAVLLFGPRRYTGTVFAIAPESFAVGLQRVLWPRGGSPPQIWTVYIGIPLLLLCALACWKVRSGVVRLSAALFVVGLVLGMGESLHWSPSVNTGIPLPDRLIAHSPLLENLAPGRYMLFCDLFVGLILAVALGWLRDRLAERSWAAAFRPGPGLAAGAVGVLALVSPALGTNWPYPARPVVIPPVYRSPELTSLPAGSILLGYPVMNGFKADPMIWQAEEGFGYDMVAGYGFIPSHKAHPYGSLPASPITNLFGAAQFGALGPVGPSSPPPAVILAVRAELRALGVDVIVVLPRDAEPGRLAQVLEIVTGRRPEQIDGAFVWLDLPFGHTSRAPAAAAGRRPAGGLR